MKQTHNYAVFALLFILNLCNLYAGSNQPQRWNSEWITAPDISGNEYGVYYFRKNVSLTMVPAQFTVHVSADNRYKLYVNGILVSLGPARGDANAWNYETVNLASYLKAGQNVVAAQVWNEAEYRPEAQISFRTGFLLQGNSEKEEILNTNNSWKCIRDRGYYPIPGYFFAASKGQLVDMNQVVKGDWKAAEYNDGSWFPAKKIMDGRAKGTAWGLDWALVASLLPAREMTYQRIVKLRKAVGVKVPADFPNKNAAITLPAHTKATLLLDQTFETNAYITLNFSGGKGAGISLGYAEALYEKGSNGTRKGNRNDIEGKEFIGRKDSIISNGEKAQSFTSLNFRTYRYIQVYVQTADEPLVIDDLYGTFTAYPFKQEAVFNSADTEVRKILDIGWRTARLNAWETYMDCPYYEQLQYIGDTRVQALISYFNTHDDILARNAINQIDSSRLPEGITKSCYPTKGTQIISPFSLWYICMLHDYWMYRGGDSFIKDKLMGERGILEFFSKYQMADGSLKDSPYWTFVDWAGNLGGGLAGPDGAAAIYDLQLLWAYQVAAEMEAGLGLKEYAQLYSQKAQQLKNTINKKYWDSTKKLYADTADRKSYSQHVNALAILTGTAQSANLNDIVSGMLNDKSLTQCTVYFKYYLNQALVKAGYGNNYMDWLGIWRENIAMGLTTWAEDSSLQTVRSDCHAWGASPNIEFYRTVLGIDSDAPGFAKVKIQPHLGKLENVSGEIPHPAGKVSVNYVFKKGKWNVVITLPASVSGSFIWKDKVYALNGGDNIFHI